MAAARALALDIIREHFGVAVECVFNTLAKHGRLSAFDLLHNLPSKHFDVNTMFHILAILLQQNLLRARRVRGIILYSVDVVTALNRLRFGHIMESVRECYPPEAEHLVHALLVNGRLGAASACGHAALKVV